MQPTASGTIEMPSGDRASLVHRDPLFLSHGPTVHIWGTSSYANEENNWAQFHHPTSLDGHNLDDCSINMDIHLRTRVHTKHKENLEKRFETNITTKN